MYKVILTHKSEIYNKVKRGIKEIISSKPGQDIKKSNEKQIK